MGPPSIDGCRGSVRACRDPRGYISSVHKMTSLPWDFGAPILRSHGKEVFFLWQIIGIRFST